MLEGAFFFCAYWITNRLARRFNRLSPIWGLHAFVLATFVGSVCLLVLKIGLAELHDVPLDTPIWSFDTPLWIWLVPAALGSVVSVPLVTGMLFLLSRRCDARLVRWAGQPVCPEQYWLHACIALVYTAAWFFLPLLKEGAKPNAYASLATLAVWFVTGRLMLLERRRRAALSKQRSDSRPPALLLRSFGLMRQTPDRRSGEELYWAFGVFTGRPSFEERLVVAMDANVGPLRALGDPADFLPELGADRLYVAGSAWQDTVADEVAKAQCLLVMEGSSPGLRWEWEFILRNVPTHKVFLLTYPNGFPGRNKWRDTVAMLKEIGIRLRSHDPGGSSLYRFGDGWEAELLLAGGHTEDQVAKIVRFGLSSADLSHDASADSTATGAH